jgi:hypothetical protein
MADVGSTVEGLAVGSIRVGVIVGVTGVVAGIPQAVKSRMTNVRPSIPGSNFCWFIVGFSLLSA